jgi:hypothetical protein
MIGQVVGLFMVACVVAWLVAVRFDGHGPLLTARQPKALTVAAAAQHENDRAWRLDEWNRGSALPAAPQHRRPTPPDCEFVERACTIARWNCPGDKRLILSITSGLPLWGPRPGRIGRGEGHRS